MVSINYNTYDNNTYDNYSHSYIICLNNMTVYSGVREAGRVLGIDNSNISKVCQGKRTHTGGYKFKYFIDPRDFPGYKYYNYNYNNINS